MKEDILISGGYDLSLMLIGGAVETNSVVDLNKICDYMSIPWFKSYEDIFNFPGLEEIITSLLGAGIKISSLVEFDKTQTLCLVNIDVAWFFVSMLENGRISNVLETMLD